MPGADYALASGNIS
jgi:hypothetical protein